MAKTFQLCVLCVLEGPRCKRGTGREEKSLKTLSLAEAAEKDRRQKTEVRSQKSGVRRQETGEGLKVGGVAKNRKRKGSRSQRSEGFKDSRIQGVKWRKTED